MKKATITLLMLVAFSYLYCANIKDMPKIKPLTGKSFGRLTVISFFKILNHKAYWNCLCECGALKKVSGADMTAGKIVSCGCYRNKLVVDRSKTHGESHKTKEYTSWLHLNGRCKSVTNKHYHNYGGRGITVCERWNVYENFLADMGRAPSPKHSIERKDNNKGYSPENCKWATSKEQSNNRRTNILIEYDGEVRNIGQWALKLNINRGTLESRLKRGWSIDRALTTYVT